MKTKTALAARIARLILLVFVCGLIGHLGFPDHGALSALGVVAVVAIVLMEPPYADTIPQHVVEDVLVIDTLKLGVYAALKHLANGEHSEAKTALAKASLRVKQIDIQKERRKRLFEREAARPLEVIEIHRRSWQEEA